MATRKAQILDFTENLNHRNLNHENHNDKSTSSTGTGGSTSSSTVRARANIRSNSLTEEQRAEAREKMAIYGEVIAYFESGFGQRAGNQMREQVRAAVMRGCSAEVLKFCIDEAEAAPRPSWGYARAVLRRCLTQGILSADDLRRDQEQREMRSRSSNPAGNFMQREYREEDFADLYVKFDPEEE